MSKFFKKKKKTEDSMELCKGLILLNSPEIMSCDINKLKNPYAHGQKRNDSRKVFAKSIAEMLVVGGAFCGLLSCVQLAYNIPFILLVYFIMAFYFSSLFKSGKVWKRDVGYILFFCLYALFIYFFRSYVNSGFYAIINELLNLVTDYYGAGDVKVFTETIGNRPLTIPFVAFAIGALMIIVLNIFVNTQMSIFWAGFFSLLGFIIPLFFRLEPDAFYVIMTASGLMGIICLKGNGHYRIVDKIDTFEKQEKKNRLSYRHSDKASLQLVLWTCLIVSIITCIVMFVSPLGSYAYRYKNSSLKEKLEEPFGNFLMYGFEALRNSANTGGLARGQLGNVSDVRFDGETDLEITFAPYTNERIYLRAFVGETYVYGDNRWTADTSASFVLPELSEDITYGRMDISVHDSFGQETYLPYYSNEDEIKKDEHIEAYSLYYVPYVEDISANTEADLKYLYVPEENRPCIERFCSAAGVTMEDDVREKLVKLADYFEREYPYTLHPGSTPKNKDYVNHFLETTKKGLCANYATAGTLILRYLGVPARYVEGYAVDYSDVLDGVLLDNSFSYEDYYHGSSAIGRTGVVRAYITDESSHAWIEALIDGRWQVVELTPPSYEDDEETEDFWSRFGRWFMGDEPSDTEGNQVNTDSFTLKNYMWIIFLVVGAIGIWALYHVSTAIYVCISRFISWHGTVKADNAVAYYRLICNYARLAIEDFERAHNHRSQLEMLDPDLTEEELIYLCTYLEDASYGFDTPRGDYELVMDKLKAAYRKLKNKAPVFKRIYLFWRGLQKE